MIDAHLLKETIRANVFCLCKAAFPLGKKAGEEWRVGNTAGDPGDSLGIQLLGDKAGVWHDWGTGEGGDFIELLQLRFGFGYREVADWVGRILGVNCEVFSQRDEAAGEKKSEIVSECEPQRESLRRLEPEPEPVPLTADQLQRMARAAHTLARSPEKLFEVLGERPEISLDAVRSCALEGDLGYEADCQYKKLRGPAVLFGYRFGIKIRYRAWSNGKRAMVWEGKPAGESWRQSLMRSDHKRIYISEGETDTLTGLSLGLEDEDSQALVVGLASATILPRPIPFAGRSIIILSDPDNAGTGAAEKLARVFREVAKEVAIVSLKGQEEGGLL
jgi:hypothetical protein